MPDGERTTVVEGFKPALRGSFTHQLTDSPVDLTCVTIRSHCFKLKTRSQERQDNHTRPYTNGTVIHNSGPVHIIASEYQKEKSPEPKEFSPDAKFKSALEEVEELVEETEKKVKEIEETGAKEIESAEIEKEVGEIKEIEVPKENVDEDDDVVETEPEKEIIPEKVELTHKETNNLVDLTKPVEVKKNGDILSKVTADFVEEAKKADDKKTRELLEEALDEEEYDEEEEHEGPEKSSVKVSFEYCKIVCKYT